LWVRCQQLGLGRGTQDSRALNRYNREGKGLHSIVYTSGSETTYPKGGGKGQEGKGR